MSHSKTILIIDANQQFVNTTLENIKIIQGLTNLTDSNGKITDLLTDTGASASILTGIKTMMDTLISRGLLFVTTVDATSVTLSFKIHYYSSLTSSTALEIYTIDMSNFYTASDSAGAYAPTALTTLYATPFNNNTIIANLTSLYVEFEKFETLLKMLEAGQCG